MAGLVCSLNDDRRDGLARSRRNDLCSDVPLLRNSMHEHDVRILEKNRQFFLRLPALKLSEREDPTGRLPHDDELKIAPRFSKHQVRIDRDIIPL